MRVKVHDRYWECDRIYNDVKEVVDKTYGFDIIKKDGFKKEFRGDFTYKIMKDGEIA